MMVTLQTGHLQNGLSSKALLSPHKLKPVASFRERVNIFLIQASSFLFLLSSNCFQHYCLIQRILPSQAVPKIRHPQLQQVCLQREFRRDLIWNPVVYLSGSPKYLRRSPPVHFKQIDFFPVSFLKVFSIHAHT